MRAVLWFPAMLADVWHQKKQNPGTVVEPVSNQQAADNMAEWQHSAEAKCSTGQRFPKVSQG